MRVALAAIGCTSLLLASMLGPSPAVDPSPVSGPAGLLAAQTITAELHITHPAPVRSHHARVIRISRGKQRLAIPVHEVHRVAKHVTRHASRPTRVVVAKAAPAPRGFASWLASSTAQLVLKRESHGRCTAVSSTGKYRGRWQMDAGFWRTYGGLSYAGTPDRASCHQQDLVAYRGWLVRGWGPWPTAH